MLPTTATHSIGTAMKTRTLKLRRDTLRTLTAGDLATVQGARLAIAADMDGQPVQLTQKGGSPSNPCTVATAAWPFCRNTPR